MNLLIPEIFDPRLGGRPATYIEDRTAATPVEHEITVAFRRDRSQDTFGETKAANFDPQITAPAEDMPGASINSQVIVHYGYLEDENGEEILTESGEEIIAENEYTLYARSQPYIDPFGILELDLSLTVPN